MTILINLFALAVIFATIALPFVLFWGIRRWLNDPMTRTVRAMARLEHQIDEAVATGDMGLAHMKAYAYTALARKLDPNAEAYVPPSMESLYGLLRKADEA